MTDTPDRTDNSKRRIFMSVGLFAAALGIATLVYVSNGSQSQANECFVSEGATDAIDAVAQGQLAALLPTGTGRGYSDMGFLDSAGNDMTMANFAGKTLLVNFWATWCGPCREEMPALNTLAGDYGSDQFEVVTINLDLGEEGAFLGQQFLDDNGLENLALYADPNFSTFERLKAQGVALGLPATLLLDQSGCEIAVLQGPAVWDSQDGRNVVERLISLAI